MFNRFKTNMFTQFKWLLWRNSLDLIRDPLVCWIYFIQTMVSKKISVFLVCWMKIKSKIYGYCIKAISRCFWFHFFSNRTQPRRNSKHEWSFVYLCNKYDFWNYISSHRGKLAVLFIFLRNLLCSFILFFIFNLDISQGNTPF